MITIKSIEAKILQSLRGGHARPRRMHAVAATRCLWSPWGSDTIFISALLLSTVLSVLPALANQPNATYRMSANESIGKDMPGPINLPDLPYYSGIKAEYLSGMCFPNSRYGMSYSMTIAAHEEPAEIIAWYASTLKQYGWTIQKETLNDQNIRAEKDRNVCSVQVFKPNHKSFKSTIFLRYQAFRGAE